MHNNQLQLRLEGEQEGTTFDQIMENLSNEVKPLLKDKPVEFVYLRGENVPNQVFINLQLFYSTCIQLISSAIKHTETGEVLVLIFWDDDPATDSQAKLKINISDTGVGLSSNALSRIEKMILKPTLERYRGHFARIIAQLRHIGAHLTIKSERFKGTTVSITLPACCIGPRIERRAIACFNLAVIISDNSSAKSAIYRHVKPLSSEVVLARDLAHAIDIAQEHQIDLLVVDSAVNNLELIEAGYVIQIRPIITDASDGTNDHSVKAHFGHCLNKPILPSGFDRQYFDNWQQRNRAFFSKAS